MLVYWSFVDEAGGLPLAATVMALSIIMWRPGWEILREESTPKHYKRIELVL